MHSHALIHMLWYFVRPDVVGEGGASGMSLLLLDANFPGIKVRKMKTQFDNTHNTTFVTLDEVQVPAQNLIGEEGQGFR